MQKFLSYILLILLLLSSNTGWASTLDDTLPSPEREKDHTETTLEKVIDPIDTGSHLEATNTNTDATGSAIDATGSIDEEDDESDLELGDDSVETDAQKDFTAIVRQSKDYTCGPAALATLMTQLGNQTSENDVLTTIAEGDISTNSGVTLLTLKKASIQLGNTTFLKNWSSAQILEYIHNTKDPVLIHDEKKGVGGHFSVIREYDESSGTIELSDTEAGNIKYSIEDFGHIYTGHALIITDGEKDTMLDDTSTDISDEEAQNIWGKYVPVYILATRGFGDAGKMASQNFITCTQSALKIADKNLRTRARESCYTNLGIALNAGLSNSNEMSLAATFETSKLSQPLVEKDAVGTTNMVAVLDYIQQRQKWYIITSADLTLAYRDIGNLRLSDLGTYQTQLATLKDKLNRATVDRDILTSAINTKAGLIATTWASIQVGGFVSNGQTYLLGVVGAQVTAQQASYNRLSSALSRKLSNLDAQINNLNSQIAANNRAISIAEAARNEADRTANYWYAQAQFKLRARRSASYELSQYQYQRQIVSNQTNIIARIRDQIQYIQSAIIDLNQQKSSAQNEVNLAQAEKARLERLKAFGDQEIARKTYLVEQLKIELSNLQKQLPIKETLINTLKPQIPPLEQNIAKLSRIKFLEDTLTTYKNQIDATKSQYGFTTISYTNTSEVDRLIEEEYKWEKEQDQKAKDIGTKDGTIYNVSVDGWKYAKANPGKTVLVGGATVVIGGGVAACMAATAGICALPATQMGLTTALGATTVVSVYQTADAYVTISTGRDILGNDVSDAEWATVSQDLLVNAGISITGPALKSLSIMAKSGSASIKLPALVKLMSTPGMDAKVVKAVRVEVGNIVKAETTVTTIQGVFAKGIKSIDGHIFTKHKFGADSDGSKFLEGADIEKVIKEGYGKSGKKFVETVSEDPVSKKIFPTIKVEVDMGRKIGTSKQYVLEYSKMRIIVDYEGNVVSAYPIGDFSIN